MTINKTKVIIKTIDHKYDDGHEDLHDRFLAKEFGFAGRDNAEQAQADEMVDVIVDLIDEQVFYIFWYLLTYLAISLLVIYFATTII